ncbi:hypothetical protein MTR67_008936 [Solanum verrucosum]|uniref:FAD-binding PCMH-type domain-containing protein n=1 Tax=Solanum verrucosum TaxID=315347 RepID=A0AAF0Q7T8_SOLVR|nr:hypothetical protein MTR67_008936 [Solanum verrucosum]
MMSRKFGTAADNIIDAKLIDANGRIKDRESMGEDHFWAIRGGGGTSFGLIISWKVKLVDIPEKVTVFNVTRRLEQNVTQLVYKWQHIADKVDDNLLLRIFLRSNIQSPFRRGQRTVHAFFTTMFVGGVDELLHKMQKSFPKLGLVKEDCIEMSWIESILFFAGFPRGTSLDVLQDWNSTTNQEYYFKGKSDYVQHPISINGLEGIWKLYNQLGENSGVELQFSPYGGKLSEISESETPFPHRAGNIFMIEYAVFWVKMENSKRNIAWNRKLYRYMAKYVSKSPRVAYFNYRDLDLGVNNIIGNTSYEQARIWGVKYFKNNFDRLLENFPNLGLLKLNTDGSFTSPTVKAGIYKRGVKRRQRDFTLEVDSLSLVQMINENKCYNYKLLRIIEEVQHLKKLANVKVAIHCSKLHDLQIRIRSGGHDYEGLSYISETPFVLIDLRNLRLISIDTENKTAWIQAGATLGEVYYRIAEKSNKLAFVAGACPTVGVGGHLSGGGFSMMSRKFGTAADNIIDAKLIDANGQIQDRESMGEDHFWAIRGGGGTSFGLIISWKVKLLDIPEKVTVFNVPRTLYQNATQLVYKWQHITNKVDDNLLLRIFLRNSEFPFGGEQRAIYASFTTMFVGGVDDLLHEMEDRFPELGLVKEDCIEMTWIKSILFFAGFPRGTSLDVLLNWNTTTNQRGYFKGKLDYVQQPISVNGLEGMWKLLNQLAVENSGAELEFSPYGGKLSDISESEIPFPHRAGNIFMIDYAVYWGNFEDSQRNIAWCRKLYGYMAKYVSKSPRATYFNFRDLDLGVNNINGNTSYEQAKNWGEKYFKNNFDRLVQVKTKFDPTNFFRNEQSIPPLLSLGHNIW